MLPAFFCRLIPKYPRTAVISETAIPTRFSPCADGFQTKDSRLVNTISVQYTSINYMGVTCQSHRLHPRIIVYYYFLILQGCRYSVPERHHALGPVLLSMCNQRGMLLSMTVRLQAIPPRLPVNSAGSAIQRSDTPENQWATGGVQEG